MTAREPWPLLAALDELLARDGWQEDIDAVMEIELRIANETGVGRLLDEYLDGMSVPVTLARQVEMATWQDTPLWKWPHPRRSVGAPFLRSRDAAAMLEEAVRASARGFMLEVFQPFAEAWRVEIQISDRDLFVAAETSFEPAARTRAALEAGWKIGLWPVKRG